ncbi:MAG: fumarylacetoacetate hydrolase family protein [Gammaproteobacteria bacterium]|nr:fumarylacetoacetate hydrolase family protein [Gammaproteobacteria bacterium]
MKFLRFGPSGFEKPGLLDSENQIRDLSGIVSDITATTLTQEVLGKLSTLEEQSLPLVASGVRLGCPLTGISKFIAIGLNYSDHAAETNSPIPKEPIVFMKATTCIQGPNDPVMLPKGSVKTDWEVELGVVIGKKAQYVNEESALDYVLGYCLINDVSEREYQIERGGTWDKGKGCDTFGPIGPWLVTKDEVGDPQNLNLWLDLNGKRMQSGNTSKMVFSVRQLVSYCSRFMTLLPGDVITTGTPPGVGMGIKVNGVSAPRYLVAGDIIELGIEGLGSQRQTVIPYSN